MRLSTLILPIDRRADRRRTWRRAEERGFHAAYTYDHLSWRSFRNRPWFGAIPTLAAAAGVTERMRLGTLVASPHLRHPVTPAQGRPAPWGLGPLGPPPTSGHPVPRAKELMSLDDIGGGRLTVGIGSGGVG